MEPYKVKVKDKFFKFSFENFLLQLSFLRFKPKLFLLHETFVQKLYRNIKFTFERDQELEKITYIKIKFSYSLQ